MRLLWVVPRYGHDVVGGAETLVRRLAERAVPDDWVAEVATTCATDHSTWQNTLPAGRSIEGGVTVHRFPVSVRDPARHEAAHRLILEGRAGYLEELEWLASGVWSSEMLRFIENAGHDLVIFAPYLFGTTVWGAQACIERAVILPCVHDEPYARLATVAGVMRTARGAVFNSPAEQRLGRRLYDLRDSGVVGMGFDPPETPARPGFAAAHGLGPYLLYAGRLEEGKRVNVAVDHAVRHFRERPGAPRLVLIGSGSYRAPASAHDAVLELGYLDEETKRSAMAEAVALVNPSHLESLSIVLMEAWLEGTPAIVGAGSEVMREHCEVSGGGVAVSSYEDYRQAVEALLDDPGHAGRMGGRGRDYVVDRYGWPAVSERFRILLERLNA